LVSNNPKRNFALEEGDVIYVSRSGIAEVGYVLRQLLPGLGFLTLGVAAGGSR
jgi:polysaccharide export outer membrane protein